MRGIVATVLVLGSRLDEMWPLAARTLWTITVTFRTMLSTMISLPSLAAVVAFAPELTPLCTWATKQCWSWRSCLNAQLGRILCCDGALRRRCIGGWHPTAALARALPLGRAPLTAPLFGAAAARAPYIDELRLRGRLRNLRRLRIARGSVR